MTTNTDTTNTHEPVTVAQLPRELHGEFLYCIECSGEYSAQRGDYFMASPDTVMTCCDQPMRLVRRQSRLVGVKA